MMLKVLFYAFAGLLATNQAAQSPVGSSIFDFTVDTISDGPKPLSNYIGDNKAFLVVNVASE